jgi:hypothetical protein
MNKKKREGHQYINHKNSKFFIKTKTINKKMKQ